MLHAIFEYSSFVFMTALTVLVGETYKPAFVALNPLGCAIIIRPQQLIMFLQLRMASLMKIFCLTLLMAMTAAQAPTPVPTSSPTVTPVVIVEPDVWKIILVGRDCPAQVWSMMDTLQGALFAVLHSYVPDSTLIPPADPTRNLAEADRELVSTCPSRSSCSKPAYVGK